MKKPKVPIIMLIIGIIITINANASSIKGYVYDKKTNEPIIGAIITVMGQNIGTQTDFDGCFVIKDVNNGTDKLVIKSLGHKEHIQTIILTEDSIATDIGKIYLKPAKSKHYNRVMVSIASTEIEEWCFGKEVVQIDDATRISGSFLHGYNFYKNFAIEAGAKYNYTFHSWKSYDYDSHSKSRSHYVAIFTNLAYNLPIRNVTISPYIGFNLRKYIYSKMSHKGSYYYDVCETIHTCLMDYFDPCVQFGLGYKYKKFYLGAEASIDLDQGKDCGCYIPGTCVFGEMSISFGYEF